VAEIDSQTQIIEEHFSDLIEDRILGQDKIEPKSYIKGLWEATAAKNWPTEVGGELELTEMDGEDPAGFFELGGGETPQSLDDLVDLLDIKETYVGSVSEGIQHFPTFAPEDMWPI